MTAMRHETAHVITAL